MKLFVTLLSIFACIAITNAAVTECYACIEDNFSKCDAEQTSFPCSNQTFPNLGNYHCYTATGWYIDNSTWKTGVLRGCANCSSDMTVDKAALQDAFQKGTSWTLTDYFTSKCCNSSNCNQNLTLTAPPRPTTTSETMLSVTASVSTPIPSTKAPTSHASRIFPIGGILALAAIATSVFLF